MSEIHIDHAFQAVQPFGWARAKFDFLRAHDQILAAAPLAIPIFQEAAVANAEPARGFHFAGQEIGQADELRHEARRRLFVDVLR